MNHLVVGVVILLATLLFIAFNIYASYRDAQEKNHDGDTVACSDVEEDYRCDIEDNEQPSSTTSNSQSHKQHESDDDDMKDVDLEAPSNKICSQ